MILTSRANPGYQALRALAEDRRARRQAGATLIDGEHLLEAALAAGITPRRLVFSAGALAGHLAAWQARLPEVPSLVLSDALFASLSPVDSPTGVLAEIAIPVLAEDSANFVVLLEDVQDPGNLGALLRTAAAAGVEQAWLSTACADAWSPKCLRGGQGAHFRVVIRERADLPEVARRFPGVIHAAVLGARASLFELDLRGAVGFAFGNEGAGLSEALRSAASPFTIPMSDRVESLNVAAAAAICLFERVRQGG
ncbi:MAG: RNA methyltransferase [Pseudomonadota bacterium]|nr:RNA methyltransferase [Pseudomonadota bacterium]